MEMSRLQWLIAIIVPLSLAVLVWVMCRRTVRLRWYGLTFVLGSMVIFPIVRLGNVLDARIGVWPGHEYANELARQLFTTAPPEEWGKGLIAVLMWQWLGRSREPLVWLSCAAASHCGFAALEGLLGAMGNEGLIKVAVGRSIGAMLHCSWGLIAAWYAWRGWSGRGSRFLNWGLALFLPATLHALGNASQMDLPGTATAEGEIGSGEESAIVLSGMASLLVSWILGVRCLRLARKV